MFVATEGGEPRPIRIARGARLAESLVTNYLMRPSERLIPLARQARLMESLSVSPDGTGRGRIGVDFGSVSLCHVATGATDATVEFAKGFAIWDLAPGQYILQSAGGTVVDLKGRPLRLDHGLESMDDIASAMGRRQKFVAASTPQLAQRILDVLDVE